MKRRGLFSFMAAAPIGITGVAAAAVSRAAAQPPDSMAGTLAFHHRDQAVPPPAENSFVIRNENTKEHGKITVYNGRLWLYNDQDGWKVVG